MSCPAEFAYGPSCPQPVMRPNTNLGLRARHTSGPTPRRSITPGRKPSITTSARSTSDNNVSTPSACFKSSATLRRPRSMTSQCGPVASSRTACTRSTRTTSAPISASIIAANGPGPMPAISKMRTPCSGPAIANYFCNVKRVMVSTI